MSCKIDFLVLIFFLPCYLAGMLTDSSMIAKKAEQLFNEHLYGDALPLYSLLFSTTETENFKTELALRLAMCHLEEGYLQSAFDILTPLKSSSRSSECLYLLSLVHKKKGEYGQALERLNQSSLFSPSFPSPSLMALEKGFHLLQLGHLKQASSLLEQISWDISHPLPYYLAQLNLAKIHLLSHEWKKAEEVFLHLELLLPENHPLKKVEWYLKGLFFLKTGNPAQAASLFESLLPPPSSPCFLYILENLIISQLEYLLSLSPHSEKIPPLLSNADKRLKQLLDGSSSESHLLLLADFYLIKGKHLSDRTAYEQGLSFLAQYSAITPEEKRELLLKQAKAAPSYLERQTLYRQILQETPPSLFAMKAWLLRGLNEFEEGMLILRGGHFFEQAMEAFDQVIELGKIYQQDIALFYQATALKHLALSHAYHSREGHVEQAWKTVISLLQSPLLLSLLKSPQEIYALAGWIALHLSDREILNQAQDFLQKGMDENLSLPWGKNCLKLKALIHLKLEEWEMAESLLAQLAKEEGADEAEALFWLAYSAGMQNKMSLKNHYLKQVYQKEPQSPYAPLAYFHLYSYRDYMQRERKAIKHLQEMPALFPTHPLLISAYYLMGMDRKKDHLSEEGQILRRHDWMAAIDAFQQAESTFDRLLEKQLIPPPEIPYFSQVREQAQLERGKLNFAIAQEATGGKRLIYLEYAENVFKDLIQHFVVSDPNTAQLYPKRWAEAEFQLAKIYCEEGNEEKAETMLNQALTHFKRASIQEGSGVMRVWVEKGKLAHQREDFNRALDFFSEGEKAMPCKGIDPEERLSLWIQQSLCHQALNQWDEAMRLLSKVINADDVSSLRIQAMFLRADSYEKQGRPELAIKQLEAISRQGGKWAQEAHNKMEKINP